MAKGKSNKDKCKAYFDSRKRIKNKTRKQEKMLVDLAKKHPEAAEKMREHNIIGRKKEKAGRYA